MSHNNSDDKNMVVYIAPLPEEALAIFNQFPADVLEEIFVHLIDLPKDRSTPSAITSTKQVIHIKQLISQFIAPGCNSIQDQKLNLITFTTSKKFNS
jgi:hypothetical protein